MSIYKEDFISTENTTKMMVRRNQMNNAVLLVIDTLKDFMTPNGVLYVPDSEKIVPNIKREILKFEKEDRPIIFVCDKHQKRDRELKVWPPHSMLGTTGAEIIEELKPLATSYIWYKHYYSPFFEKFSLKTLLDTFECIEELHLCGVCTDICVLETAMDALQIGYSVKIIGDACATFNERSYHDMVVNLINNILQPKPNME